jgi:hypothetical protein
MTYPNTTSTSNWPKSNKPNLKGLGLTITSGIFDHKNKTSQDFSEELQEK